MKVLVHDYAGHPFQVQLSRQLACRGNDVVHVYFAGDSGPKGIFENAADDTRPVRFVGITMENRYDKTSLVKRRFDDISYGRRAAQIIKEIQPDVVISGNTPCDAQTPIILACEENDIRFVYWLQDFYSLGITTHLRRRIGYAGAPIAWYYRRLERRQLRASDAVISITEDFVALASTWAGSRAKISVIENWATLEDLPATPRQNRWAEANGLHDQFTFLYCGTLGLKHKADLLVPLARDCPPGTVVAAVAEGAGTTLLRRAQLEHRLNALHLYPLQPIKRLAEVLATADVLVAMLDVESGTFAVPSKILSYLCAGRPILLAAPRQNLAAQTVTRADAGIVVDPNDEAGFLAASARLRNDPELRTRLGQNGRAYAERTFNISRITDLFETILSGPRDTAVEAPSSPVIATIPVATA